MQAAVESDLRAAGRRSSSLITDAIASSCSSSSTQTPERHRLAPAQLGLTQRHLNPHVAKLSPNSWD
ncbi:unnamed protein product [Lampetra planeri]